MASKIRYKKTILITSDVETTSILNNCLSNEAGDKVKNQGMPLLLQLFAKHEIKTTFFFCGDIVRLHPETVTMAHSEGHEIGSHGWSHYDDEAFDVLSLEDQVAHMKKSKNLLEEITKNEVISFRAPALRINNNTCKALHETGFKIDTSISSQRIDMLLTFGAFKKMRWLLAKRNPYFVSSESLYRRGSSRLLEIPVSAFGLAYIGSSLRVIPLITKVIRYILHLETCITGKPIVFLTHPNEFIDETESSKSINRRGKSWVSHILVDKIRRKLKLRNLGSGGLDLLEREILFFKSKGYVFLTCAEYYSTHTSPSSDAIK